MRPGARLIPSALLLLLAVNAGSARQDAPPVPPRIIDFLDLASDASRAAHGVQMTDGDIRRERIQVGTLILPVAGVALPAEARLTARLKCDPEGGSILVTLATATREYGKRQAYRVMLDGKEVYHAVDADPGAGNTRSFFLDVPAGHPTVLFSIAAAENTLVPVTVSRLRTYSAINHQPSNINRMGLALLSPAGGGYSIDPQTIRDTFHKLPHSQYLTDQLAVLYNFCSRAAPENAAEIGRLTRMAEAANVPVRIAFQVHWGGIPKGVADGAGGTFTDLPYQQITFDPESKVEDAGVRALMGDRYDPRYGLSTPNRWGDTPWLTFNHPRLNQLRRIRLLQALFAWRQERERLAEDGNARLLPDELSTGDETIYWAKGVDDSKFAEVNGKPRADLMADFNPFVVADALKNGVNLDPRDGLDNTERWWLHQNLAHQQQRIVDWMLEGIPADPIQLGRTDPFAADEVRRNIYTEPYGMPLFPMKLLNPLHPGLEAGCVKNGRSGGEYWSGATMLPWLLKERERGRIALPNLECSGADDPQLLACLQAAYACGARFATLYNWQTRDTAPKLLRAFADSIETGTSVEFPSAAIGYGTHWEREYVAAPQAFGVNRVELFRLDRSGPVTVRVGIRIAEPGRQAEIATTTTLPPSDKDSAVATVLFPTLFSQEPGKRYVLSVEAIGTDRADFALGADGKIAGRLGADLKLERARSQVIASWQDAADLLESVTATHAASAQSLFAKEALVEAQRLLAENRPEEAYRAGIRAEQLSLPASFSLPAPGGRLTPYWIKVLCPAGPVAATITSYTPSGASISVRSRVAQRIHLLWGRLETTANLSPNIPAEIALEQPMGTTVRAPRRPRRRPAHRQPMLGPPLPSARPAARPGAR